MMKQNIQAIARACNGTIIKKGSVDTIGSVSTDTRTIQKGSLFVPLIGEKFDGHTFIEEAIKNGAQAVFVQEGHNTKTIQAFNDVWLIEVKDTLKALQAISVYYRKLFPIPFIGVTGSVGKTSTKDLISGVISGKFNVHKNLGNFNNEIGLPLTLFNLEENHQISVLEMGMSSFGEIRDLVDMVHPEIGVITNIGVSHIEHLGSKEGILKAKMEIASNFKEGNYLLVNGDDEYLRCIHKDDKDYTVIFYGLSSTNDFYPMSVEDLGEEGSAFTVEINGEAVPFKIRQLGIHNVYNALAAVWIGLKYHMTFEEIQRGLDGFQPSKMRLEVITKGRMKIINDAYNASPDSMKAALDVLDHMKSNRKIAVLGNMFEMGSFSEEGHRSVGAYFAKKNIDILVTVGEMANWIGLEAKKYGIEENSIRHVFNNKEAIEMLGQFVQEEDAILVKGSRGMAMEEIVNFLQERS